MPFARPKLEEAADANRAACGSLRRRQAPPSAGFVFESDAKKRELIASGTYRDACCRGPEGAIHTGDRCREGSGVF